MGGVAGWGGYIGGRAQTDRQTLMTDSDSEVDKIIVTAVKFPHFGNVKRSFPTSYLALSLPSTAPSSPEAATESFHNIISTRLL